MLTPPGPPQRPRAAADAAAGGRARARARHRAGAARERQRRAGRGADRARRPAAEGRAAADRNRSRPARRSIVCAFGALIKEPLLSEHEILNVHPSLLPRWRGAAPIERAIMAGDERTGVSIMRLTAGLDSGPGVPRGAEPIGPRTPTARSSERLQELGGELLLRALSEAPAVRRAARGGRHLRREDRRRGPPARSRAARRPSSSARCARCTRTSARASRSPTARCSACGARALADGRRAAGDAPARARRRGRDGRLLLRCSPGVLELLVVQPPGGARWTPPPTCAASRRAGAPVGAHVGGQRDARRAGARRARACPARDARAGCTPAHAASA